MKENVASGEEGNIQSSPRVQRIPEESLEGSKVSHSIRSTIARKETIVFRGKWIIRFNFSDRFQSSCESWVILVILGIFGSYLWNQMLKFEKDLKRIFAIFRGDGRFLMGDPPKRKLMRSSHSQRILDDPIERTLSQHLRSCREESRENSRMSSKSFSYEWFNALISKLSNACKVGTNQMVSEEYLKE